MIINDIGMPIRKIIFIILLFGVNASFAGHLKKESEYRDAYSLKLERAQTEVRGEDGSRVDILDEEYAYEVEFAGKWKESIGQALHYGDIFKRKGAIVLIVESQKDFEKYLSAKKLIRKKNLDLEVFIFDVRG